MLQKGSLYVQFFLNINNYKNNCILDCLIDNRAAFYCAAYWKIIHSTHIMKHTIPHVNDPAFICSSLYIMSLEFRIYNPRTAHFQ